MYSQFNVAPPDELEYPWLMKFCILLSMVYMSIQWASPWSLYNVSSIFN